MLAKKTKTTMHILKSSPNDSPIRLLSAPSESPEMVNSHQEY